MGMLMDERAADSRATLARLLSTIRPFGAAFIAALALTLVGTLCHVIAPILVGSMITAIARTLTAEHDVFTTGESPVALAWIDAGDRFDVILCDLMMPVMNGIDLFAAIQERAPELASRVVFFSGGAFTDEARAFLDRVENAALEKPFEPQQLRALVNARVR